MSGVFALGPWAWMILAAILFALEVMSPGIFLMWFGMAAAATGPPKTACGPILGGGYAYWH